MPLHRQGRLRHPDRRRPVCSGRREDGDLQRWNDHREPQERRRCRAQQPPGRRRPGAGDQSAKEPAAEPECGDLYPTALNARTAHRPATSWWRVDLLCKTVAGVEPKSCDIQVTVEPQWCVTSIYGDPQAYQLAFSYRDFPAEVDAMLSFLHRHGAAAASVLELAAGPADHAIRVRNTGGSQRPRSTSRRRWFSSRQHVRSPRISPSPRFAPI